MTMRIHRAVRTLSLLLALSMLLSVSAISSAAETPAPSVLTVSDSTLALVDRDQAFTATLTVDASVLGDASPDAWAAGLTWYLTREEGFQDGTLYPYYYPGDRLDRWQVWNNGEGGDALFTLGDASRVVQRRQGHRDPALYRRFLYRHQRRLLQKPERLAQLYRHVHPVRPER
ncbi:MAG: hypothetical protein ACLRNQ_14115 [Flavonifractor plautii]